MMKKILFTTVLVALSVALSFAQTNGTLSVSVVTSSAGGNYAPRNIVAIWIEDSSGKFVKTLLAYANTRITYLNTWEAATTAAGSVYNKVDAVSGATQNSHGTRTCSWNSTDASGKLVADGTYTLRMELTDKNSTGNTFSVPFIKGPNSQKLSPADVPSFSSISLNWSGIITGIAPDINLQSQVRIVPNPGNGLFTISGVKLKSYMVRNITGKMVHSGNSYTFDISDLPNGMYFVSMETDSGISVRKIIKH